MRYGHGSTSNSPQEQRRRKEQPAKDEARREQNRKGAIGGGKPNESGVIQGQSGEQIGTTNSPDAANRGKVRH